jgi:16S rRNA (guanine527-N7)-methyltransferase
MALPIQNPSAQTWQHLLQPYLTEPASASLRAPLETYLDLLLRWNARINLTAIRQPEQIIQRHFGESLLLAGQVPRGTSTLLDHGSGAGFPGLPIALARPEIAVTLSESHTRKSSFLREVIRLLNLGNVSVHAGRTESLPADLRFDAVTLRAVDNPKSALFAASERVAPGGQLLWLAGTHDRVNQPDLAGFQAEPELVVPNSAGAILGWRCG